MITKREEALAYERGRLELEWRETLLRPEELK
jgi:hypothetical protein